MRRWRRASGSSTSAPADGIDARRDRSERAEGRDRESSDSRARLPCFASRRSRAQLLSHSRVSCADRAARLQNLNLTLDLELERLLEVAERVDVLDFGLGAERRRSVRSHRHVRVAAEAALLHVAVVDAERDEDLTQLSERIGCVGRRPQVGLGHDLDQRRPAAVEIEVGFLARVGKSLVQRFTGVLLHVDARNAHPPRSSRRGVFQRSAGGQRLLVLRNLIALGKIRVEVVFPRKNRPLVDRAVEGQGGLCGKVDGPAVQNREGPRKAKADRADVGVRRLAESRAAAAENLRISKETGVYFEANNRFKCHEG